MISDGLVTLENIEVIVIFQNHNPNYYLEKLY